MSRRLNPNNYNPYDPRVEGLPGEELEDGSDVLWTDGKRICIAAQEEQLDLLKRLLDSKTSPSATDKAGYTGLHYAARNGSKPVVQTLLDAKADVNAAACSFTPLLRAAYMGHVEVACMILEQRADPQAADSIERLTPLHKAAEKGHVQMIELLLRFGASSTRAKNGKLPEEFTNSGEVLRRLSLAPPPRSLLKLREATMPSCHEVDPKTAYSLPMEEAESALLQRADLALNEPVAHINALLILATFYAEHEMLNEAQAAYERCLQKASSLLHPEHAIVAEATSGLAGVFMDRDELVRAEPLLRQAMELKQQLYGARHTASTVAMNDLAVLLRGLGRLDEALCLNQEAVEVQRQLLAQSSDIDPASLAQSLYTRATLLSVQGRAVSSVALACFEEALSINTSVMGPEHPHVLHDREELEIFKKAY